MKRRILKLFIIFLKIGAFTFGGGYAMIPLIEKEVVEKNNWIEKEEFLDSLAACQSVPGALAVNNAVYIGYKLEGLLGALAAALGVILPSFFIILIIAAIFTTIKSYSIVNAIFIGIRACVVALIATAGLRLLKDMKKKNMFMVSMIVISFISIAVFNINPFIIVVVSSVAGIVKNRLIKNKRKRANHDIF
ncbi:chromate transporter [Anaerovirgula multivorans]|uniref:Chromate transporter n=1 Tax=Anaerovirgula multivorans TaxID=312168 RepID=A0A239E863_9FIRM|nr:chromate transporter [Anaerovirgula multivorans]SNS40940.1 chromate transporter [Anaerovirgula multivorans]